MLLRAILENPDEDDVRLRYADWLEENGEEGRGQFIRDAVRWPSAEFVALTASDPFPLLGLSPVGTRRCGPDGDDERTWGWGDTETFGAAIWDMGRDLWYHIDRGFIDAIRCTAAAFTEELARELFSRHPVTSVVLADKEPVASGLGPGGSPLHFWPRVRPGRTGANLTFPSDSRHSLPPAIWDRLYNRPADDGGFRLGWNTPEDAKRAAFAECVAYGRELAGLALTHAT